MPLFAVLIVENGSIGLKFCSNQQNEALTVLQEFPSARLLEFNTAEGLLQFLQFPREANAPDALTEMEIQARFKAAIESNDVSCVMDYVGKYRRLLVNSKQLPRVLNSSMENVLHMAARNGHAKLCESILDTIRNPSYIDWVAAGDTRLNAGALLSMYLNTPNKSMEETPLHIASKRGFPPVVAILIAYPECQYRTNKNNSRPQDIIAVNQPNGFEKQVTQQVIADLLELNYYVPLFRFQGDEQMPVVGEPVSREHFTKLDKPSPSTDPARYVAAFAGPMTLAKARDFYCKWQYGLQQIMVAPPNKEPHYQCQSANCAYVKPDGTLKSQPGSGMERMGRLLATTHNVGWSEHWKFLGMLCDLRDAAMLRRFEVYLAKRTYNMVAQNLEPTYAIGLCAGNRENVNAMVALKMVYLDERLYPNICRWRAVMRNAYGPSLQHVMDGSQM